MSTRRGGVRSRAPAHQNTFAYKHNKNSKKTAQIAAMPIYCWSFYEMNLWIVVCNRCREKIEWKKKYRKYKPLTAPGKCEKCGNRNVKAAYHHICDDCARVWVIINNFIFSWVMFAPCVCNPGKSRFLNLRLILVVVRIAVAVALLISILISINLPFPSSL